MIRTLLKLGVFLVVCLLGYNYFFGDATEKEQSRAIVRKAGDLGKDAWNLLKSEKSKMDDGKYDDALEKMDALYAKLRNTANDLKDSEALDDLAELNERRKELQDFLSEEGETATAEAERKMKELTADTEELMEEMEQRTVKDAPY